MATGKVTVEEQHVSLDEKAPSVTISVNETTVEVLEYPSTLQGPKGDQGDPGPQGPQGEEGPQGPPGATTGDKHFTYEQAIAAATWDITHNLNKNPSVTVVDTAGSEWKVAAQHVDQNRLILYFQAPFAGTAYLN